MTDWPRILSAAFAGYMVGSLVWIIIVGWWNRKDSDHYDTW